jgi:hypothetical protein
LGTVLDSLIGIRDGRGHLLWVAGADDDEQ